jgi:hypothetical protein
VLTNVLAGRLGRTACWRGTLGRFSTAEQHQAMSALARMGRPSRALSDERLRQIYGAASDELILPREEPAAGSEPPPITPAYAFS